MAGEDAASRRPHVAAEGHECKRLAEDPAKRLEERLVWAVLAVAAELQLIRKQLRKG